MKATLKKNHLAVVDGLQWNTQGLNGRILLWSHAAWQEVTTSCLDTPTSLFSSVLTTPTRGWGLAFPQAVGFQFIAIIKSSAFPFKESSLDSCLSLQGVFIRQLPKNEQNLRKSLALFIIKSVSQKRIPWQNSTCSSQTSKILNKGSLSSQLYHHM